MKPMDWRTWDLRLSLLLLALALPAIVWPEARGEALRLAITAALAACLVLGIWESHVKGHLYQPLRKLPEMAREQGDRPWSLTALLCGLLALWLM